MVGMIAGKTESEILSMGKDKRVRWYRTILLEDKKEAMWIVEIGRRVKISKFMASENNPTKRPEVRAKISAAWTDRIVSEGTKVKMRKAWTPERRAKQSAIMINRIISKETRTKLSEARIGENNPNFGNIVSEETRSKISVANTGNIHSEKTKAKISVANTGKNNPNWQGGKSFEPYGSEFNNDLREQIRKRDGYVCQECDKKQNELGQELDVHHIDYDKINNNSENLISLCRSCHMKTNYSREDWTEYFRKKK